MTAIALTLLSLPGLAAAHLSDTPGVVHAAQHAGPLAWLLPLLLLVAAGALLRRPR